MNNVVITLTIGAEGDASPGDMVDSIANAVASLQLAGIHIDYTEVEDWDEA